MSHAARVSETIVRSVRLYGRTAHEGQSVKPGGPGERPLEKAGRIIRS